MKWKCCVLEITAQAHNTNTQFTTKAAQASSVIHNTIRKTLHPHQSPPETEEIPHFNHRNTVARPWNWDYVGVFFLLCLALIYTSVLQLWEGNSASVPLERSTGSRTLAHFNGQCNNLCTGGPPLEALLCTKALEAPLSITRQSLHYSFTSHPFIIYWPHQRMIEHGVRCYAILIKDPPLCQNVIFCYRAGDLIVWFDNRSR